MFTIVTGKHGSGRSSFLLGQALTAEYRGQTVYVLDSGMDLIKHRKCFTNARKILRAQDAAEIVAGVPHGSVVVIDGNIDPTWIKPIHKATVTRTTVSVFLGVIEPAAGWGSNSFSFDEADRQIHLTVTKDNDPDINP